MKKVLLFSVLLVLFCLSALLPTSADAGSPLLWNTYFYESDYDNNVERAQHVYTNKFPKSATRYVNSELHFVITAETNETYTLLLKYYKPDGSLFGETTRRGVFKKSGHDWTNNWIGVGIGWKTPGNWPVGHYRVEAYLDGVHVATDGFEIYNDK